MKLLIKFIAVVIILVIAVACIWGGLIIEKIASANIGTEVDIAKTRFLPHKLIFVMEDISLPQENVSIPEGIIHLMPIKLELYGLDFKKLTKLGKDNFQAVILKNKKWEFDIVLEGMPLNDLNIGLIGGTANGNIKGTYDKDILDYYAVIGVKDVIPSPSISSKGFLGLSSEQLQGIIQQSNGDFEMDFSYSGPRDDYKKLYRYKPGSKTINLIRNFILQSINR